jgi:hypothetical protein
MFGNLYEHIIGVQVAEEVVLFMLELGTLFRHILIIGMNCTRRTSRIPLIFVCLKIATLYLLTSGFPFLLNSFTDARVCFTMLTLPTLCGKWLVGP